MSSRQWVKLGCEILERDDLSATAKIVYAVIVDRMGRRGKCWPGVRRLATDTGMGKSAVAAAVEKLLEKKLLRVQEDARKGCRRTYLLPVHDPPGCPDSGQSADPECPGIDPGSVRETGH